jgi:ribose transport system ATP-binding protein
VRAVALSIENVSKAFPGVQALSGVGFTVAAGEVHGLVGENGAGKSTLMAIACGAQSPDSGRVLVDQQQLDGGGPAQARDLGLAIVRQEPALVPSLTVAENLWLAIGSQHRPTQPLAIRHWAESCLARWSAGHRIDPSARVATLTPEQRFVVEIAKALAQDPKVLLLDEPTEHLDAQGVDLLFDSVRALAAEGCAVVYISHRIREVRRLVDRVTVLRDGLDQGTYEIDEVTEAQIVDLIVGRSLDATFPPKARGRAATPPGPSPRSPAGRDEDGPMLELSSYQAPRCAALDLAVARGEIVGLAGIDGNGQRDLLRSLAGLTRSRGRVRVAGTRASVRTAAAAATSGIVYVPNDRHREGILAESDVRANLVLRTLPSVATLGVVRRAREQELAASAATRFDVRAASLDVPVGSLSGGNQQKVVLAGALTADPRVLLVDEPTQGVDVGARAEIYAILRDHADAGRSVVVLASDALELAGLCDRVLVFSRGQVAGELTGSDVTEHRITETTLTSTVSRAPRQGRPGRWRVDRSFDSDWTPTFLIACAILGLALYGNAHNGFFLSERNIHGVLALTATLTLAAAAQQLVMLVGGIDLSVGPLMGLLVVISSFFLTDGTPPGRQLGGWILFVAVAVAAGLGNWLLVELARLPPMVATLVTYMAFQGVSLLLRPAPDGLISLDVITGLNRQVGPVPLTLIAAAAVVVILQLVLTRTKTGLSLRAVGSAREAARLAGVRPRLVTLVAYVGCSVLCAGAALPLIAQVGSGDPTAGLTYTLASIAAAVIGGASVFGGRGSFVGCLMGALLVQEVASVTTFLHLSAAWQFYLLGGMILVAVSVYSKGRAFAEAGR